MENHPSLETVIGAPKGSFAEHLREQDAKEPADDRLGVTACSEDLLRGAGYVLQEAVEKLLALPEQLPHATEEELEDVAENGYAPEIRDHAETVLLARNALRIAGSLFPQNADVMASLPIASADTTTKH